MRSLRSSRCGRRRRVPVLVVLVAIAAGAISAVAGAAAPPKASKPVTILYTGTFSMRNQASPESTAHSYTYRVSWTYWWTGTWGALFRDPTIFRAPPAPFTKVRIAGNVSSTYKEKVDAKVIERCSSTLTRDKANRPTISASYDTSADTLQVIVEAPTFRGVRFSDPSCADNPGTNVFGPGTSQSPPSSFNPLGAGGIVTLSKGGTERYGKRWSWKHTFASSTLPVPVRTVAATMRSTVTVTYAPCAQIAECATAKP